MSRSAADLRVGVAILAVALAAGAASGQPAARPSVEPLSLELGATVRRTLAELQENWVDWLTAHYGGDEETAAAELTNLLAGGRELGFSRLPGLGLGAATVAARAASDGDFVRARQALAAARQLAPDLPEVEFAAARVEGLDGSWLQAPFHWLKGCLLLLREPGGRIVAWSDLLLWGVAGLLLAAVFFVVVEMAARGGRLHSDLAGLLARFLPPIVAHPLALALLLWPLALPGGGLWLVVYWSVLVWSYAALSERVVLVAAWVLLGVAPLLVSEARQRVRLELAPEARAVESLVHGDLDGALFSDLSALFTALPDSVAVLQLAADVNRLFGQVEAARALYLRVLDQEPQNAAAIVDLGTCYFKRGDFEEAIDHFQRAAVYAPVRARAYFNLSQAYSETYRFDQAGAALREAQALDDAAVSGWIKRASEQGVVAAAGGFGRAPEIRGQLVARWRAEEIEPAESALWRRTLALPVGCLLLAVLLQFTSRGWRHAARPSGSWWRSDWDFLRRVLLPGFPESERGRWASAFLAILVPIILLTLPLLASLGYRLPWSFTPTRDQVWLVTGVGLTLYFARRLVRQFRHDG